MKQFFKQHGLIILSIVILMIVSSAFEYWMGRLPLGPDGKFGFWEGDIWSSENSQRLFDPYSFSHFLHGVLFYALLVVVAKKASFEKRFLIATFIEITWELLENSPIIINRYREATIAAGYNGDSILNSMNDVLTMMLGFWFASRVKPWVSIVTLLVLEIGCLLVIRDNLTLNILMLIYPFEGIKSWQAAGHLVP